VQNFSLTSNKSKAAHQLLTERLKLDNALVVDARTNTSLHRSVRNLAKFDVLPPEGVNLESVLRRKHLVLTSDAAKALEGALS
jgi:large subunit ribosomal protein L4